MTGRDTIGLVRSAGTQVIYLMLLLSSVDAGFGQSTVWNASGTGNFVTGSNWSDGVPNSSTSAQITNGTSGTPTDVSLNSATGNVLNLSLGGNNELDINLNSTLSVFGTSVANSGALNLTAGSGNNSFIQLESNVTLTGSGALTLSYGDHNGNAYVEQSGGTFTLTNSASTIQGDGIIGNGGLAFANGAGGTVNANVSGQSLILNGSGGVTNVGLLEATRSGILQISSNVANAGGNITANGGTVNVSAAVTGGTLTTLASGVLQTGGSATLNSVTLAGSSTYLGGLGTTTAISGSITNSGNLQFNAGSGNNTVVTLGADTTLLGGGTLTLNSGDTNGFSYVEQTSSNLVLTNFDNEIQGYGIIGNGGLAVVNSAAGTLDANVPTRTLTLNGTGGVTNSGLLEATGNGTMQLSTTVNNLNGNITANAGTVDVSSTIEGGTLNTLGGGTLQTSATSTLDGTTQGPITISLGSVFTGGPTTNTQLIGAILNVGSIQLFAGSGNNSFLNLIANSTLQGGGSVTLNSGDNNGQAYIQSGGSFSLTNIDNTIEGYGILGHSSIVLNNNAAGIVNANISGQTLLLNGGNIVNAGLLEATNGGILQITTTVDNSGANITANGGTVLINSGATIQGGTLNSMNGGNLGLGAHSSATLDGSAGALAISTGSTYADGLGSQTSVLGTIANHGNIQLNAGSANNTVLSLSSATILQGGGTVTLNSGDNNGQAFLKAGNGLALTNIDNEIEGYGDIGNGALALANNSSGVINANVANNTLLLDGTGNIANAGTLEATNSGILRISNVVTNSGNITSNGGTVNIVGGTVQGGTLNGAGLETTTSATLDGSTNGSITLSPGAQFAGGLNTTTNALGSVNNLGNIQLNAGSGNNTTLNIAANATLQGGGTVTLNSGDNNGHVYIQTGAGSTLTNVDNSIQGYGEIGHGSLALSNGVAGIIDANIASNTLLLDGTGNVANAGTLEATSSGTLQITNVVTNNGNITAGGGTINIVGGSVQGGTLNGAGLETTTSATLDGSTNGTLTLSPGAQFTGARNTTTTVLGLVNNAGNIQLIAGGGNNTALSIAANTTLQGGGIVTLNSGDNNGQAYIQQSAAGTTLTNAGDTLEGYGILGNGGLSFMNAIGGTLLANAPGQTLQVNATGSVTNSGTFQADDSTLSLVSQPTNLAGDTLTGGTWTASSAGTVSFEGTVNAIITNNATLVLDGAGSAIRTKTGAGNSYQQLEQTLITNDGTLEVIGNRNFSASNGLANNGLIQLGGGTLTAPSLVNGAVAVLAGFGTFSPTGGVAISNGAQVSPGGSVAGQRIATLSFGTAVTFGPAGSLVFDLMNAPSAVAGTDYDTVAVAGSLSLTATPGSPFSIALRSVNPGTGNSGLANFNPMLPYSWTLVTAGTISGFNPAAFAFNTSGFQNSLNGGAFLVSENGNSLELNFTPVPEPGTWALMIAGLAAMGAAGAVNRPRRRLRPAH